MGEHIFALITIDCKKIIIIFGRKNSRKKLRKNLEVSEKVVIFVSGNKTNNNNINGRKWGIREHSYSWCMD